MIQVWIEGVVASAQATYLHRAPGVLSLSAGCQILWQSSEPKCMSICYYHSHRSKVSEREWSRSTHTMDSMRTASPLSQSWPGGMYRDCSSVIVILSRWFSTLQTSRSISIVLSQARGLPSFMMKATRRIPCRVSSLMNSVISIGRAKVGDDGGGCLSVKVLESMASRASEAVCRLHSMIPVLSHFS